MRDCLTQVAAIAVGQSPLLDTNNAYMPNAHSTRPRWPQRAVLDRSAIALAFLSSGCDMQKAEYAQVTEQSALRGRALITQYQCGSCHAIPGVANARGVTAVSLAGFSRRSYIAGRIPNQPDALALWIIDPHAQISASTMPTLAVSPEQARDMAAYLWTLK